ncbi:MAG TPA: hypothetical protein PLE83_09685 [Myxococcota bacterium]|nr:hypothetical protein [Myxococcota bacterium]
MRKTFLAMGSALLLALTFAACDTGEDDPEPLPQENPLATKACKDYRTDLGDYYVDTCGIFSDSTEFGVWFTAGEANCDDNRWNVRLTDLQTTHWEECLVGIGNLTEADCAQFEGEEAVYLDDVVPECGSWWPPKAE